MSLLLADGRELALASSAGAEQPTAVGGYELVVGGDGYGGGGRVLGHRQFARYYRQKYRAGDPRHSIAINRVLAQCAPMPPCDRWRTVMHFMLWTALLCLTALCLASLCLALLE